MHASQIHSWCHQRSEDGIRSPETVEQVTPLGSVITTMWVWESNLSLLEEQYVLVTSELTYWLQMLVSFQCSIYIFIWCSLPVACVDASQFVFMGPHRGPMVLKDDGTFFCSSSASLCKSHSVNYSHPFSVSVLPLCDFNRILPI